VAYTGTKTLVVVAGGSRIVPDDLAIVIDRSGRAIIIDIPIINWVDTIPTWLLEKIDWSDRSGPAKTNDFDRKT
jgi:hypothetical protein